MSLRLVALSTALVAAMVAPAVAEVVIKGRIIPEGEMSFVRSQCATLKAREWGNSQIEDDPNPNEDLVPSGNAHRVRTINLYTLTYQECRKAGLP
jgi:hypothetical protein